MDRVNGARWVDIGDDRRGFRSQSLAAGIFGTEVTSDWLNAIQEELLTVIQQAGLEPDPDDWTQLYQALQLIFPNLSAYVTKSAVRSYLAMHPRVLTVSGKLAFTTGAGSVTLSAEQGFVFRGLFGFSTDDLATRTLATQPSKTYHVRIRHNDGTPALALKDLADAAYNPGALLETHPSFDTSYDDLFAARVTTDAANVPTVRPLVNMPSIEDEIVWSEDSFFNEGQQHAHALMELDWDLARTPIARPIIRDAGVTAGSDGDLRLHSAASSHGGALTGKDPENDFVTRYGMRCWVVYDGATYLELALGIRA